MLRVLSWNIQAARGVDGVTDPARIATVARATAQADIFCFQEVLQETAGCGESAGLDQVAALGDHFPGYACFFGPAVDMLMPGGRRRFGNVIFSRLPVLRCAMHRLPHPVDRAVKNMPRQATEILVEAAGDVYRVVTTHLEYFSQTQRSAQVRYLYELYLESLARADAPTTFGGEGIFAPAPETRRTIFCGDFNLTADSHAYRILADESRTQGALLDAWTLGNPGTTHPPTCGIYDHEQWQEGPHCRDFFFVSPEIARCELLVEVNTQTDASDHQPLVLSLA